ncbi:MAG: hypothetical protein ACK4NH_01970, partial [Gemmobacter sp.]
MSQTMTAGHRLSGQPERGGAAMATVGFDRPTTLHLVTADAGLVRWQSVLLQILRSLPQERHVVLFTAPCRDQVALAQVTAAGGFWLQGPADAASGDYGQWITGRIDRLLPQRVMVHASAADAQAVRAALRLAPRFGRRLYLLHGQGAEGGLVPGLVSRAFGGATHLLGPGVAAPCLRAGLQAAGHVGRVHVARLGLPFDPVQNPSLDLPDAAMPAPLPATEEQGFLKSAFRAALAFVQAKPADPTPGHKAADGVTATACSPEDLARTGPDRLADLILGLVRATGGRHVHVGPVEPRFWHAMQLRLSEAGLPPERVLFTGPEASVVNALRYHRVTLFLGSLPGLAQAMGLSGVAWAGIPIARFAGKTGPGGDAASGPDETLDWDSPTDLARRVATLSVADLKRLGAASRLWHLRRHSAERFNRRLKAVIDVTEGSLSAPISRKENADALAALFDAAYYLKRYPDIAGANLDPLRHYRKHGEAEGRSPNPLFHPWHYRAQLPAGLTLEKTSLLAHYLLRGEARGLTPHPYFVPACAANGLATAEAAAQPDEAVAHSSILARYLRQGSGLLSPHPLFDPNHYARAQGIGSGTEPLLLHYLDRGAEEGLSPHPLILPERVQGWGAPTALDGLLYWLGKPAAEPGEPTPDPLFDPAHLCGD